MNQDTTQPIAARAALANRLLVGGAYLVLLVIVVASAVLAKEARVASRAVTPLVRVEPFDQGGAVRTVALHQNHRIGAVDVEPRSPRLRSGLAEPTAAGATRWFDGRPVRVARTIRMKVTAYSPDARSCGPYADGKTATLHSVWTNSMKLVAADPRMLPYGSMLTVPGYASDSIVPVLDCGGAIKGNRLDLLFPTHQAARRWGVRTIEVQVWEYADGLPAPNPRKVR